MRQDFSAVATDSVVIFVLRAAAAVVVYLTQLLVASRLGAEELGRFVLAMSWLWLLAHVCGIGFYNGALKFIPENQAPERLGSVRGFITAGRLVTGIAALVVMVLGVAIIFARSKPLADLHLLIALAILPPLVLLRFDASVARAHLWFVLSSLTAEVLRPVLVLILIVLALWLRAPIAAEHILFFTGLVVVGLTLTQVLVLRARLKDRFKNVQPCYETSTWVRFGLPIVLIDGVAAYYPDLSILLVGAILSAGDLAAYNIALRTAAFLGFAAAAVGVAVSPRIAALASAGDMRGLETLARHAAHMTFWPTLLGVFLVVAVGNLILATLGEQFAVAFPALVIIACAQAATCIAGPLVPLLYLTGHQHDCLRIAFLALGVTAVLVPSLAWKFGITGAAAAYAGTVICWTALLYRAVRDKLGIQPLISARSTLVRGI